MIMTSTIFGVITMGISRLMEASFDAIECHLAARALRKRGRRQRYRAVELGPNRKSPFSEERSSYGMGKLSIARDGTGTQH